MCGLITHSWAAYLRIKTQSIKGRNKLLSGPWNDGPRKDGVRRDWLEASSSPRLAASPSFFFIQKKNI